jgi:hypothetical protein
MAVRRDNDVTLHDMLLTAQFDYLRRFRFGGPSGVRGVTRVFRYRKETGGAEQVRIDKVTRHLLKATTLCGSQPPLL